MFLIGVLPEQETHKFRLPSGSSFKLERRKQKWSARQDTQYSSVLICYILSLPSIFSSEIDGKVGMKTRKKKEGGAGKGRGEVTLSLVLPPPFLSFVTLIPTFASSSLENALLTTQAVAILINLIAYTVSFIFSTQELHTEK